MYAHTLSPFAAYCLRISLVLISCSRRERQGGRTKERKRERETLSPNCEQEIVQRPDDTSLSPLQEVYFPIRPSVHLSVHLSIIGYPNTNTEQERQATQKRNKGLPLPLSLPLSIRISFHRSKQPKLFSGARCWICSWRFEKKKKKEFCQVLPGWFLSLEVI